MQLQPEKIFDNRYLLKKLLGSGGFSEVWLVEDIKVGNKKMALKVFAPDRGLDDDGVKLFSHEFELVFDLNHTHLLRPVYFDVYERSPYLLLPYCENGSATKLLGRLTEEESWRFLHDVAAGLAFLHAQNPPIIHQDIKPDNILKDNLGQFLITDFGISAQVRSTLRKSVGSATSGGTLAYMPPERFGKENAPVRASDIWAVGVTLFELIAGYLPFGEHGGLVQKSGAEIPNLPGKWEKNFQEIIKRCLRKDPWDRPLAQQIVDWTEKHLKGEKIVFDQNKKKSRNKKILLGIVGSFLNLLIIFFAVNNFIHLAADLKQKLATIHNKTNTQLATESTVSTTLPSPETSTSDPVSVSSDSTGSTDSATSPNSEKPPDFSTSSPFTNTPISENSVSSTDSENSSVPPPAEWIAEYDRILSLALSSFRKNDYVKARSEYVNALNIANQNGDKQKISYINGRISACDKAIEEVEKAEEEARQKIIQERFELYNLVGSVSLGSDYLILRNKSNNRWGIITKEGVQKEEFNYSQVSQPLRDGCFGLKNDQGWEIFDVSATKIDEKLENLDDYQIKK